MPNPTAGDVHVNAPLGNISIAWIQDETQFISQRVFQTIPVLKQSDRYFTYDRRDFNRDEAQRRAPGSESAGGGYRIDSTPTYFCDPWAWHHDVPDQIRANSDNPLDQDRDGTIFVTQKLLIRREKLWASKYMVGSLWGTEYNGVSGAPSAGEVRQWNDYVNSDPLKDSRTAITAVHLKTGFRPNKYAMGQPVWDTLVDHPDIIDRVKYGQSGVGRPAMVTKEAVAQLLELNAIEVGGAIEDSAGEGQTESQAWIVGKSALLAYVPKSPGIMIPAAGYTFSWTGYLGASNQGSRIKKFRMEQLASDRIEGEIAFDQKVVSTDLGSYFDGIIA